MIVDEHLISWLEATNRRYSEDGIPHKRRPFMAMIEFTRERKCSIPFNHPISEAIFKWFREHSPPTAHQVGSVYTGVYFYDTAFWPIEVPLVYGTGSFNPLDSLDTMPRGIKENLISNERDLYAYTGHWMNCMDYGYRQLDLERSQSLNPLATKLLGAAHSELQAANSQLLEIRPNRKAILTLRMAIEMFLKVVLAQELGLSENELRKVNHNLDDAAKRCADSTKENAFEEIRDSVGIYPSLSARYDDTDWPASIIWKATALTQRTATIVVRIYSGAE